MSNEKKFDCQNFRGFKNIQIIVLPENIPPFSVDAKVFEQDTALILGTANEIKYPMEDIERLINQALEIPPFTPGSILVREQTPLQLLAIIHDLDKEPTWQEEWIIQALHNILRECEHRQLQSIAMPLLGNLHGSLKKQRFFELLHSLIEQTSPVYLKQIWLYGPPSQIAFS